MGSFGNSNTEVLNPHCPCPLATPQYAHMHTHSPKIIWGKKVSQMIQTCYVLPTSTLILRTRHKRRETGHK